MATEPETKRPLRADAERNRRRILEAAAELFAERGLQVSLDDVAARAGVGVGTVYRRFPNREALVNAVLEARVEELITIAEEARANPDAWEGLKQLIEHGAEFHGRNRALKQLMFSDPGKRDWVEAVREKMRGVTGELVERAKDEGKLRGDLATFDVPLTILMLSAAIEFTDGTDAEAWRRLLTVVFDGLLASRDEPSALEAEPLTVAEIMDAMQRSGRAPSRDA
jgi:AcrR family transcriptional regulator